MSHSHVIFSAVNICYFFLKWLVYNPRSSATVISYSVTSIWSKTKLQIFLSCFRNFLCVQKSNKSVSIYDRVTPTNDWMEQEQERCVLHYLSAASDLLFAACIDF